VELKSVSDAVNRARKEKEYNEKYLVFKQKYVKWYQENPDKEVDYELKEMRFQEIEKGIGRKRPEMTFLDFDS